MFTEPIRKPTAIQIIEEAEIKFYIYTLISETKSKMYSKPHRYLVAEPEAEIRSNSLLSGQLRCSVPLAINSWLFNVIFSLRIVSDMAVQNSH